MNESLLNSPEDVKTDEGTRSDLTDASTEEQSLRPDGVPDKFWNEESNTVRVDTMVKSYQELERKLGGAQTAAIPDSADEYEVTINGEIVETDNDVNTRLHAAGLTNEQLQTVYELAHEKLMPTLADMSSGYEADKQTERLKDHFGGEEKWDAAKRQIAAWGRENFSDDVFNALSSTYEGVLTMQKMIASNEPGLSGAGASGAGLDENALKAMMSDPRYWRMRDPGYIERVRQGFRILYPEN